MNRASKYKLSIIDQKFESQNSVVFEKTAKVIFPNGKEKIYGYMPESDFVKIIKKKNVVINDCLIEDAKIIKGNFESIKVKNCFFYSKDVINFTVNATTVNLENTMFAVDVLSFNESSFINKFVFKACYVDSDKFDMNDCLFSKGINFKESFFEDGQKMFERIYVEKGEVNFSSVEFTEGSVSFQEAYLGIDKKNYALCKFGEGFVDFTRTNFGDGNVVFERADFGDGNISFRMSNFGNGIIDFRRSRFGKGELNFTKTNFQSGDVKFMNVDFGDGKITFRQAFFGEGNLDFHFSTFGDADIFFDKSKFNNGMLDFRGVEQKTGKLSFNHIEFSDGDFIIESFEQKAGQIFFKDSVFGRGFVNFENSICPKTVFSIENVDFGSGKVSFNNSIFQKIMLNNTQLNNYVDLRIKKCKVIDLSNSIITDILDFDTATGELNVENINLLGVRLIGRIHINWLKSGIKQMIHKQKCDYVAKSEQFRLLKENYRLLGLYDEEDFAYLEFKRMESKAKMEKIKTLPFYKQISKRITHFFEILIFDKMGEYATNPIRVLLSMLVAYLFFSFIYWALEILFPTNSLILSSLFESGDPNVMGKAAKAFYHSAITFLTIGYGDYYPVGAIRILSAVEGFTGLFLMSYFTVAFVRKILR